MELWISVNQERMSKMKNSEVGKYIKNKATFKGNNLFAVYEGDNYVVYSYGKHFPILAWIAKEGVWYRNVDKYSISTNRHQNYVNVIDGCTEVTLEKMKEVLCSL